MSLGLAAWRHRREALKRWGPKTNPNTHPTIMPAKSVTKDWLSQIDLFSGLSKDQLNKLVSLSQKKRFKKGDFVFKQGDPSEDFQIIQSGRYDVFLWDQIMKIERPLNQLAPGEVFGEIGVLTGEPRSASIRCVEEGVTWTWEQKRFVDFLENHENLSSFTDFCSEIDQNHERS